MWNYFTGVRDFPVSSFKFAVNANAPAVPVAVTYKKRKNEARKPKFVINIGEGVCSL